MKIVKLVLQKELLINYTLFFKKGTGRQALVQKLLNKAYEYV